MQTHMIMAITKCKILYIFCGQLIISENWIPQRFPTIYILWYMYVCMHAYCIHTGTRYVCMYITIIIQYTL